ncbi:MAG: membrane protein insertion efficiency factor YidD [Actinobacteria bacterium]|nr:membrane protein insertion efficiency factor YidD [Actinomycetota bacterium]
MEERRTSARGRVLRFPSTAAAWVVKAYGILVSSWTPPRCRFYPTCSQYMVQALERHGLLKGGLMGLRRILRCHPLNEGGYDPVPER